MCQECATARAYTIAQDGTAGVGTTPYSATQRAAKGRETLARATYTCSFLGTPCGELDLVLRRGDLLLGLEVKTARARASIRPAGGSTRELADLRWRPGQRWSRRQARRAGRALRWLCTRTAWAREARLALVEVYVGPPHRFHLEPADGGARSGRRERADRGPIN